MPTYEYACLACGTHVEVYQRFSDPPLAECGVCGGPLRKVFHPAGILFKGSGFYVTDSRGKKSTGAPKSGEASKEPAPTGTSKPESKGSAGESASSSSSDAKSESATKEKSA